MHAHVLSILLDRSSTSVLDSTLTIDSHSPARFTTLLKGSRHLLIVLLVRSLTSLAIYNVQSFIICSQMPVYVENFQIIKNAQSKCVI